tara:strand:- start:1677 stop:1964 length:288 start_codon:yes stop_codon:yes gene_type:complete
MSLQKVNTNTVRAAMKSHPDAKYYNDYAKVTVIKRDGKIVVRLDDGGSCRNSTMKSEMFAGTVSRVTGLKAAPHIFHGQKNLYAHTFYEAIITLH